MCTPYDEQGSFDIVSQKPLMTVDKTKENTIGGKKILCYITHNNVRKTHNVTELRVISRERYVTSTKQTAMILSGPDVALRNVNLIPIQSPLDFMSMLYYYNGYTLVFVKT